MRNKFRHLDSSSLIDFKNIVLQKFYYKIVMKSFLIILIAALVFTSSCEIMPRNTMKDCRQQCKGSKKSKACYDFCDCIHRDGKQLDSCLEKYENAAEDSAGR